MIQDFSQYVFRPSSMNRLVKCNGSVRMNAGKSDEDSPEASQGIVAHSLIPIAFNNGLETLNTYLGTVIDGVVVDQQMINHVTSFHHYIRQHLTVPFDQVHIEEPVDIPDVHAQCKGTPDLWWYDATTNTLFVWDFKYGFLPVHAFENWQLISYTLGVLNVITRGNALQDYGIKVKNYIYQPRKFQDDTLDEWSYRATDLRAYANILNDACNRALSQQAQVQAGKHCIGCLSRVGCPALRQSALAIVELNEDAVEEFPTPQELGNELHLLEISKSILNHRIDALSEELKAQIKQGASVSNYNLEQGLRNREWTGEFNSVVALGKVLGVDFKKPDALITPAKAKELLEVKGIDSDVIESFVSREPGSLKLKYDDGSKAKQTFTEL